MVLIQMNGANFNVQGNISDGQSSQDQNNDQKNKFLDVLPVGFEWASLVHLMFARRQSRPGTKGECPL